MANIVFSKNNIVQKSFGGLGVEFGVYEDPNKLTEKSYEVIYKNLRKLNPTRIRCMVNYEWFLKDFVSYSYLNENDEIVYDKTKDTWRWDFANKNGQNLNQILSYCQTNNIEVAIGAWNAPYIDNNESVCDMRLETTSDIRWAKMSAEFVTHLVKNKGYTCIRWFVSSNEPNYLGDPSSKNYLNTYEKWEKGVKQVRAALDEAGLNNVGIVGGDTTGVSGTTEYWTGIANNIKDYVADYGFHFYPSDGYIDTGDIYNMSRSMIEPIKEIDEGMGTIRPINVWECGLLDGKDSLTDSNRLIRTTTYAVRMADYTVQALLSGVNGICYWSFDDAMNYIYNGTLATPKRWGMFSSLESDQPYNQALRPWFHSSMLLTNLIRPGAILFSTPTNDSELDSTFRCIGINNPGTSLSGLVAVNRTLNPVKKTFAFATELAKSGSLYTYIIGEGNMRLDEDGYIIPNSVITGDLDKRVSLTIPGGSVVIVTSERI